MQEKAVFDTNVYIDIFNKGLYQEEINAFEKVMYLAYPVLHELWIGAKGKAEIRHLLRFGNKFIRLNRLIQPHASTQILIGQVCRKLKKNRNFRPDSSVYLQRCLYCYAVPSNRSNLNNREYCRF